jgi:hypothetical protein
MSQSLLQCLGYWFCLQENQTIHMFAIPITLGIKVTPKGRSSFFGPIFGVWADMNICLKKSQFFGVHVV